MKSKKIIKDLLIGFVVLVTFLNAMAAVAEYFYSAPGLLLILGIIAVFGMVALGVILGFSTDDQFTAIDELNKVRETYDKAIVTKSSSALEKRLRENPNLLENAAARTRELSNGVEVDNDIFDAQLEAFKRENPGDFQERLQAKAAQLVEQYNEEDLDRSHQIHSLVGRLQTA